ncbi:GvpL/GvpF family gas vesicle protein [Streptomyces sp. AK02-01A]|uniref:GvpL/GvpF family gas vesicle protein n=1 Tax=Streptomyces sp. AK02-01A TaxID=3028648 RepID=UPI0029B6000F|nr:GvpL/GvpF family gas vesicle protein [Streptomyces sp. AK02-01A]MDX3850957.1 GvpL/GvpF family gas vesicle protein [Streptomyces sp. AK02-01A]
MSTLDSDPPGAPETIATYVFAVCRGLDPAVLSALPGLSGNTPVRALRFGPLTAVVQHVEAALFTAEAWQERLSDQRELERCARAHHQVVSAAAACGPTVPLALATLYRGDERAGQALQQDADRFHTALRRIEGRVEWGVKVYAATAPAAPAAPPLAPTGVSRPAPGAGRAYLDRKRGVQRRRELHHDEALRTADTVDTALRALAAASRRLRTHGQEPTGARGAQVLNAAYLVAADRTEEVADAVRSLRRLTGAHIEMSGPWVPYSFAGEV